LTFFCVVERTNREKENEEVNGKWLKKGKEREMKRGIGKEINKIQKITPACIATDTPV
jgi:hypothetical protein